MKFTIDQKKAVVARYENGVSIHQLCTEYNIPRSTLYRWCKSYKTDITCNGTSFTVKEINQMQNRITKLNNIIEILKSVNCTVSAPLRERLFVLESLYGQYDVHTLCEALNVDRGTFYNHIRRNKRGNAWFAKRREEYRHIVQEVFDEYHQILGPEKLRAVLVERGHQVSTKFITSIMKEAGLCSIRTNAKADYLRLNASEFPKNQIQQKFKTQAPNQVWVSDVTCFKVKDKYFYICVILDLFSRKVVAYGISKKNSTQLVTSTFNQAVSNRGSTHNLIFHSDRGSQYMSYAFQRLLLEHCIKQSVSAPGRPHDNAVAESFFASLKRENLYRKEYSSEKAFRAGVFEYIEFYNKKRPHKLLKNRTPCQFEEMYFANET
ncbi:IS3 family transposase [Gemmiger sp.]